MPAAPWTFSWKDINKYPPSAYRTPAEQSMMSILGNQYVSWASPTEYGWGVTENNIGEPAASRQSLTLEWLTSRSVSLPFSQYPVSWVPWHLSRSLAARRGQEEVMAGLPGEAPLTLPFLYQPESVNFAIITIDLATLNLSVYFVAMPTGPR